MENQRFVEAYQDDERPPREYEGSQKEVLETADRWSNFFADQLYDYLSDVHEAIPEAELSRCFYEYFGWVTDELEPILNRSLYSVRSERSARLCTHLNFHVMNHALLSQWWPLLTGKALSLTDSRRETSATKQFMSCLAVERLRLRESISVEEYHSAEGEKRRSIYEGILTEYDTAIVLLDAFRDQPECLVLPAPGMFEHGSNKRANVDFIVLDTEKNEAIGVQTKASVTEHTKKQYDSEQVVLVDGVIDFGNQSTRRGRLQNAQSTAGLIAAEQVMNIPTQGRHARLANSLSPRAILQAKVFVNQRVLGPESRQIRPAAERVGSRVREALYRRPKVDWPVPTTDTIAS